MARANVRLEARQGGGWVMLLPGAATAAAAAPTIVPLRSKPPKPEDEVVVEELAPMPLEGAVPEPGFPGVDAAGRLVPWFGGGGGDAPTAATPAAGPAKPQAGAVDGAAAAQTKPAAAGGDSGAIGDSTPEHMRVDRHQQALQQLGERQQAQRAEPAGDVEMADGDAGKPSMEPLPPQQQERQQAAWQQAQQAEPAGDVEMADGDAGQPSMEPLPQQQQEQQQPPSAAAGAAPAAPAHAEQASPPVGGAAGWQADGAQRAGSPGGAPLAMTADAAKGAAAEAPPPRRRLRKDGERGSGSPSPSPRRSPSQQAAQPAQTPAAAAPAQPPVAPRVQPPLPNGGKQNGSAAPASGGSPGDSGGDAGGAPTGSPGGSPSGDGGGGAAPSGEPSRETGGGEGESMGEEEQEGDDVAETQQQDKFDTQCAKCDDGGDILMCDGPCMRCFHTGDGCNVLRLPPDLAGHLTSTSDTFLCPNCLAGVHQCFVCKKEGIADSQVFKCINASCGRHYHLRCAGVEQGEPFVCKLHTCKVCGGDADAASKESELVPCRRCPTAYHRRCLPGSLPRNRDNPLHPRVWLADYDAEKGWLDGVEASLIYCLKHTLDPLTGQATFATGPPARQQPYSLINGKLLARFLTHYAREYRHLESSRKRLAEVAERKAKVEADKRQAAKRAAAAAAAAAGPEGSDQSEEDIPLQQKKRRRLEKAGGATARTKAAAAAAAAAAKGAATPSAAAGKAAKPSASEAAAPRTTKQQQQRLVADLFDEEQAATAAAGWMDGDRSPSPEVTIDAAEVTQDAEDGGTLVEPGEEVVQPVPAGARAGVAALPSAAAATQQQREQRREQQQQRQDRQDLQAAERRRLQDALDRLVAPPSKKERQERVRRLLQEAEDAPSLTKDALWHATRRPEPYRHAMKKTIDEAKLKNFENAVQHAVSGRVPPRQLLQLLDRAAVQSIIAHYDDLFMVLAPYLRGERYSSYGRHFTSQRLLRRTADRLAMYLRTGDQVVDFSCGENAFVPLVKKRCLSDGIVITGRSYDIILAKDATDFVLKSWFDTRPGQEGLAPPGRLCICLNPPFGKNNSLADKFVRHAASFAPRLIALIVPPRTLVPPEYERVYENAAMCGGEEFYVPGSTHRSWNKDWPVLRILMRRECCPHLAHQGNPAEFEEMVDCTTAAAQ